LPINKKIILFSSQDNSDYRKGYFYFKKIMKSFKDSDDFYFLSIGKANTDMLKYKNYKHINFLPINKIPEIYSLSDIFLCTSIVDNLPLTVLEALSSGNLVISLDNGGASEVVNKTGYVYKIDEIGKLINQIKKVNLDIIKKKSKISRSFSLKNFNEVKIESKYKKILKQIQSYPN
jgi:glycosyltransferase involved in cell wall biosynthesis